MSQAQTTTETSMWRALNLALHDAMAADPDVIVLGQDLTTYLTGGGNYGVTSGILAKFGPSRIRNTPISEEGVASMTVGAAVSGLRPVLEIMTVDFSLLAFDPIVNQAAKIRYMFGGQFDVPMVLRMSYGTHARNMGAQHSQSLEAVYAAFPGLEVVMPSTPNDAYWLLRSAINSPNPTIFLEHKSLYVSRGVIGPEPIPLGKARVAREGRDVTLIANQLMLHRGLEAAQELQQEGIEVEVVDLRSLYPLDLDTVYESARKTRRVVVAHEATRMFGYGAELAASISEACWSDLSQPVRRVGAERAPVPYSPPLMHRVVPTKDLLKDELRNTALRAS